MMAVFIFWLSVMWYIIGWLGFVFWWTKDCDFRTDHIFISICVSILGPFTWIAGYFIHLSVNNDDEVLIKKKEKTAQ